MGVALSVIIEFVQYHTGIGLAEIDDVISNGVGMMIGVGFGYLPSCKNHFDRRAVIMEK